MNKFLFDYGDNRSFQFEQIYNFMIENQIDAHTMVEMNANWHLLPKKQTINKLACGWFENQKVSTAYNFHNRNSQQHQSGGKAIISQGDLALRCMGTDADKTSMGSVDGLHRYLGVKRTY